MIGSDLFRSVDEDEEPLDSGPTVIEKVAEELPTTVVQFGDEHGSVANEGNGVADQETDDDEDIPSAPMNADETSSTKKPGRASAGASRGSTPKTPKSTKGAASTAGRKRKADNLEEPAAKRPGRGRATAAAASEAISSATSKRPKAAPGTKVCRIKLCSSTIPSNVFKTSKATGAKRGPKPKNAVKDEPAQEFEVEEIKDSKSRGKLGEMFLVKWKGYGEDENTWEPKANLAHAADLLKEFEATREERQKAAPKKKIAKPAVAAKKAVAPVKAKAKAASKTKTKSKKVAPAKKAAPAKPASTSRNRAGRPRRN